MFLHVCLILFTGGGRGAISACIAAGLHRGAIPACITGGIPACLAAGLQGGGDLLLGGVPGPGGSAPGDVPGPRGGQRSAPGGCLVPEGLLQGGSAWLRPPRTPGGMHPTGMHSCFHVVFSKT